MTALAMAAAGVIAPAAEATVHHPICMVPTEPIGPPTDDDPCVDHDGDDDGVSHGGVPDPPDCPPGSAPWWTDSIERPGGYWVCQ
jgi:hypothetical protein